MPARSWFVLTMMCALMCTSGCGSARWGNRHSRLRPPRACVESSCDDPTCEICSPLPPLYEGMARSHRLNRRSLRAHRRHAHGFSPYGFNDFGGCCCGQCGGDWFEGEIIEGEIIGGDFGGCSSCMSGGMMIDGGMPIEMSGGCSNCEQHVMHDPALPHSSMMPGQSYEVHGEPQPTPAPPRSSLPAGSPSTPPSSSVPAEITPAPMGQPMNPPMSDPMPSATTTNYGAALFGTAPAGPGHYVPASSSQPVMQEQPLPMQQEMAAPMSTPPAPPLASPAAHAAPVLMSPPAMPSFPGEQPGAPQPSDFYSPKSNPTQPNPIQLQSASIPAAPPAKKPMRPFSEAAKPTRKPAGQPQWEGSLQMQSVQPASGWLPALPPQ